VCECEGNELLAEFFTCLRFCQNAKNVLSKYSLFLKKKMPRKKTFFPKTLAHLDSDLSLVAFSEKNYLDRF
jgi:hypothetical protein